MKQEKEATQNREPRKAVRKKAASCNKSKKQQTFWQKHGTTILLIAVFFIGLSVLLYPNISDFINSRNASRAVTDYETQINSMSAQEQERMLKEAQAYNERLMMEDNRFEEMTDRERTLYDSILNVNNEGMMCYLEIPSLRLSMPVYHSTMETILQKYIGHVEGSSMPVGGPGTHAVVSGHRGLPSAELFTNLDRMEVGDLFQVHVLGETLTYEVDDISTVLPAEVTQLSIEADQDRVTLVTCTPYGVNTHRLLVRGMRIPTPEEIVVEAHVDAAHMTRQQFTLLLAGIMLLLFLIVMLLIWYSGRQAGKRRKKKAAKEGRNAAAKTGKDKTAKAKAETAERTGKVTEETKKSPQKPKQEQNEHE